MAKKQFTHQRVLVPIPDHTRSLPLPFLFRVLVELLRDTSNSTSWLPLGTHPPLSAESLNKLVGITADEQAATVRHVGLLSHAWDDPAALVTLGVMVAGRNQADCGRALAQESLPNRVAISALNKTMLD